MAWKSLFRCFRYSEVRYSDPLCKAIELPVTDVWIFDPEPCSQHSSIRSSKSNDGRWRSTFCCFFQVGQVVGKISQGLLWGKVANEFRIGLKDKKRIIYSNHLNTCSKYWVFSYEYSSRLECNIKEKDNLVCTYFNVHKWPFLCTFSSGIHGHTQLV